MIPVDELLRGLMTSLPSECDAILFDTDHLASDAFTKIAPATCDSIVVPSSMNQHENARGLAHRGAAATNAPSPPPATLSHDPLEAPYTAPVPRAGFSERARRATSRDILDQLSPIPHPDGVS